MELMKLELHGKMDKYTIEKKTNKYVITLKDKNNTKTTQKIYLNKNKCHDIETADYFI